jgi:hypothetical protein
VGIDVLHDALRNKGTAFTPADIAAHIRASMYRAEYR